MAIALSGRRQIDVYPRKQLAKLYSGQFPADAFVPWSKTIYDHKFEIDEQKVRTKHFVYRSHEGYDLEMYIDLPASGSGFPVLFHIFGGGWTSGTPERVEVISKYLASLGIAGVRVGHSLSTHPGATIARAFDDINYARQYVFRRAAECRIDTTRYGYVGAVRARTCRPYPHCTILGLKCWSVLPAYTITICLVVTINPISHPTPPSSNVKYHPRP